jgi:dTDP-L-rhamnose 4-epimerase
LRAQVLVTGGAGFIGSHLVDALVERGHRVRILDNLEPQVHGASGRQPSYLNPEAEFVRGDVRDREVLCDALEGIEIVFHKAAAVGVGQSMYEIRRYAEINTVGGATLLDVLANEPHDVRKLVVASSMSVYGEGKYRCSDCGEVFPRLRSDEQLLERQWEMRCPRCDRVVQAAPTDEEKPLRPTSIYAITKRDHEEMFLCTGQAYGIPTVALRYFNVYGPRQALSNPYTGVVAIFSSRILNGNPPAIYEDGLQSRDLVHVSDIVQANLLAMDRSEADGQVLNVGTGRRTTVLDIAQLLLRELGGDGLQPQIVGKYRHGDIRHCYADISKIHRLLGFSPRVTFEQGMKDLLAWVRDQEAIDGFEGVKRELDSKSLVM